MNTEIIVQSQINLMNECYQCLQLNELCPDCLDTREARDAEIAWQIVDEGNVQYKHIPSIAKDMPSGHDWTERATEFLEQTVWLSDRIFDLDDSVTLTEHECICQVCHYTINKHAVCPNCN